MRKKVLAEFWAKKSGVKNIEIIFLSFFVGTVLYTVLVYVSREKMKKGAIYELDSQFKEKYLLNK